MSVVHSTIPLATLPESRLKNSQIGYSEVLTVPAANAAALADYVNGENQYGGLLNPSGDYGHDHSGGYFGKAIYTSIGTSMMDGLQGGTGVIRPYKFYVLNSPSDAGGTSSLVQGTLVPMWIPGCDEVAGAYNRLGVSIRIDLYATTLASSDTLEVIFKINDSSHTFTVSSPNVTGLRYLTTSSLSDRIKANPGATNNVSADAKVIRSAGGSSTRSFGIVVHEIEFGVYST